LVVLEGRFRQRGKFFGPTGTSAAGGEVVLASKSAPVLVFSLRCNNAAQGISTWQPAALW